MTEKQKLEVLSIERKRIASMGGKACLKKHGKKFFVELRKKRINYK